MLSRKVACIALPSLDQTNVVNKRMVDWLRYASVQQGVAQPSGGFFSTPRARQVRTWHQPCCFPTGEGFCSHTQVLRNHGLKVPVF